jgi:hypothetical protein
MPLLPTPDAMVPCGFQVTLAALGPLSGPPALTYSCTLPSLREMVT